MVTPEQATRAFTLFAYSEAAKLRGQQLTTLYVRPNCADCDEAKALLDQWDVLYLVRDITEDEAAQTYFETAGYRTVPQIYVGDRAIVGGLGGLKRLGESGVYGLIDTPRPAAAAAGTPAPAAAPADREVRELLATLAERANAIAIRTANALRLNGYGRSGEGQPSESIQRLGSDVGGFLEVMNRLADLGAISSDVVRMGAELKTHQFSRFMPPPAPGGAQ